MTTGYFPGCSLTGTSKEYDISFRALLGALGKELVEIDDWSCCGASSAHVTSHLLATALPARNLALAARQGLDEVVVPCAACYSRLADARHALAADAALRAEVEELVGEPLGGLDVRIKNVVQYLREAAGDRLASLKKTDLKGLKAACYYGCLLLRPHEITRFDDAEDPSSMEALLADAGAGTVAWNFRTECCGAGHSIARRAIVVDLAKKIIDDARGHGADCIAVACPMCHVNLDMRQTVIRKGHPEHRDFPVLYLTQLLGIALGIPADRLGIGLHFVDALPTIAAATRPPAPPPQPPAPEAASPQEGA